MAKAAALTLWPLTRLKPRRLAAAMVVVQILPLLIAAPESGTRQCAGELTAVEHPEATTARETATRQRLEKPRGIAAAAAAVQEKESASGEAGARTARAA
jgi:hypothetical protein